MLSSIFTFLAGIFIVLIWRAFSFLCCRNRDPSEYQKQQEKDKLLAQQGQPPGQPKPKNLMEGNFVTEAKDWAGELISGQTTTGRILVSDCGYVLWLFLSHVAAASSGGILTVYRAVFLSLVHVAPAVLGLLWEYGQYGLSLRK